MSETKKETKPLTEKQQCVLDALTKAKAPLSAYSLLDELRDDGFRAPLQIYRALEKLMQRGLVHRLESLNAFVACRHSGCGTHVHSAVLFAICDTCGGVQEKSDPALSEALMALSNRANFDLNSSIIELKGQCSHCKSA